MMPLFIVGLRNLFSTRLKVEQNFRDLGGGHAIVEFQSMPAYVACRGVTAPIT